MGWLSASVLGNYRTIAAERQSMIKFKEYSNDNQGNCRAIKPKVF